MKKFFALCLIATIFLSGCVSNNTNRTIIKFSSWGSQSEISIIKPLLEEFEKQNPDIKVDFIHIPQNYFQKLHLLVASNLTPDAVFINNLNLPMYAENGIFRDLSKYLDKNVFFPEALEAFRYKGKLYAIPRDVSNLVVYYNKDIFDRNKIPYPDKNWTFNEFLQTCRRITKDLNNDGKTDIYGTGFEEAPLFWLPWLWGNGGGLISKDLNSVIINKPESIESLQFYTDLRNKYHVAPSKSAAGSSTMAQLFIQGKIAMHISGRWSTPKYRKDIGFNWDIARFPKGKAGSIVDCDSSGWAISSGSKHPDKALKLIKFFAGRQSIEKFAESGLIVPARIDVANSDIFLNKNIKPENSKIFIDIIPDSMPTPVTGNYQEITDIINNKLEPLWSGDKTARQVVDEDLVNLLRQ